MFWLMIVVPLLYFNSIFLTKRHIGFRIIRESNDQESVFHRQMLSKFLHSHWRHVVVHIVHKSAEILMLDDNALNLTESENNLVLKTNRPQGCASRCCQYSRRRIAERARWRWRMTAGVRYRANQWPSKNTLVAATRLSYFSWNL